MYLRGATQKYMEINSGGSGAADGDQSTEFSGMLSSPSAGGMRIAGSYAQRGSPGERNSPAWLSVPQLWTWVIVLVPSERPEVARYLQPCNSTGPALQVERSWVTVPDPLRHWSFTNLF